MTERQLTFIDVDENSLVLWLKEDRVQLRVVDSRPELEAGELRAFASVLFAGEFTAPVVAFLGLVGYSFLANMPGIRRYLTDIHDVMSGVPNFTESTGLLTGPLPWATLLAVLLATATLIGIGAGVTNRQDF